MKAYLCNRIHSEDRQFMAALREMVSTVDVHPTKKRPGKEMLCSLVRDYDIVICGIFENFDAEIAKTIGRLKILASLSSGLDHIDLPSYEAKGVAILHTPHVNAVSVAEHTWAMILFLAKHLGPAHRLAREGDDRNAMLSRPSEIQGKTIGLIGAGPAAFHVAGISHAFKCPILVWTFHPEDHKAFEAYHAVFVPTLETLIEQSDIITVHLPLSEMTRGVIKREYFGESAHRKILINTSRKEIVEPGVLALDLAGKGLDVFSREDIHRSQEDNMIVTPHIAGLTQEALSRMKHEILRRIKDKLRDMVQG